MCSELGWGGQKGLQSQGRLTGIPFPQFSSACSLATAIQLWLSRLSAISDVMDQWLLVQNMWMYMEAVFRYHNDGMANWLNNLGERSPQGCAA